MPHFFSADSSEQAHVDGLFVLMTTEQMTSAEAFLHDVLKLDHSRQVGLEQVVVPNATHALYPVAFLGCCCEGVLLLRVALSHNFLVLIFRNFMCCVVERGGILVSM